MKTLSGKWLLRFLIFFSFTLGIGFSAAAQCTFGKGDLVFTGYNLLDDGSDGNTVDDSFSFLLLNKIPAGQEIFFTDLGWTSSNAFQTSGNARSDAIIKWTADVAYSAGTEIIINCKFKLTAKAIDGSTRGTVTIEQDSYNSSLTSPTEHMSLGEIAGDQIFAFLDNTTTPVFLAGISVNRNPALNGWDSSLASNELSAEKSTLPAGLVTAAQNLIAQKLIDGESVALAARYDKSTQLISGLPADLRTAINTVGKWEIKADGNPFIAPILTAQVYAVTGASIETQPLNSLNVCQGSGTAFTVVASNLCTYQWKVSTDAGTIYNNVTNTGVYSGATTATLTISSVTGLNNYKYMVEIYGRGTAAINSTPATLTLVNPTIVFTPTLPDATLNTAYSQTLAVSSGGSGTFTYSLASGTLPTGLTLTPATGVISGTPTVGGTFNFDITVSDNCTTGNTKTNSYAVTVALGNQAISGAFTDQSKTYSNVTFTLPLNTDAGLPVTYVSETPTVATISGNTVTLVGVGSTKITATQAGNSSYNPATPVDRTLTVTTRPITVTVGAATKVYGQPDPIFSYSVTSGSLVNGNTFTGALSSPDAVGAGVGNYAIIQNTLTAGPNYDVTYVGANLSITAKALTLSLNATPLITKVYDNTTTANLAAINYSLTGIEFGDVITVSGAATYNTKDVGTDKIITANTFVLAGAKKDNYSLTTTTASTTGNITTLPITLALNASPLITKVYNNSTTATLFPANYSLTGVLGTDVVAVSGTAVYDNKDVGTGKTITANTFVLTGAQQANYSLTTTTASTTGNITALPITLALNASPVITKVYDNSTTATLVPANYSLNGVLGADAVTVSGTAAYDTKDVGTGKTITANTFVLAGAQQGNYSLTTTTASTTGNITALPITLALNASPLITKVYNNSTTATLFPANYSLTGVLGTDVVAVSGTAVYDNKDVGTGKTITANTFVLTGAQQANYSLTTTTASTTGNITALPITLALNASPVITKVYDNSTTATLAPANYSLSGVLGADLVTVSGMATYNTKDAGVGKAIIANGFVLAGAQQGNYNLTTTTASTTGDITNKTLTVALKATPAITKVYDDSNTATLVSENYTLTGVETGDEVVVSGTATYDNKNAGADKTITANTFVLSGAQKDNYTLSNITSTTTGDITTKALSLTLNAVPLISKVYDNSTTATLFPANYSLTGVLGTDVVAVSGTAVYDNKDVGTGKTITANTFVLTGAQQANYSLTTTTASTTGNITALPITLALNASPVITKVYDNSTTATLVPANYSLNGVLGADAVTVSGTAAYDTKDVGTGKTITANTFVLAGAQQGNYSLTTTTASTTGNITALPITLALNASPVITKVYDNSTTATLVPANYSLSGVLGTDVVAVSGTTAYNTKDAGTDKTITANTFVLTGAQQGNYNLTTTTASTTGNITALPITLALNASPVITKVYDNSTTATLAPANYSLSGVLGADLVTVSGMATYNTKDAGVGKAIIANGFVLAGAQQGNYNLTTTTASTTGDITNKTLTVALKATPAITKVYDDSNTATLVSENYTLTGVETGDEVVVSGTATYDNKNAGADKTITANTFVLSGAQKDNYTLSNITSTTTGDITTKALSLTLNAVPLISKVYDNSTTATLFPANYSLTGVLGADVVAVSGTAVYNTKDVGTGKTITANTFVLTGAQQANYSLTTTTASTTGNITALPITLALNALPIITKVYDNNATATLVPANYSLNGVLGADAVTISGTAAYDTKDVGTGKTITANTFVLAGAQQGNYSLTTTTATTTGNVTTKAITASLNPQPLITKVYNNTTTAALAAANYSLAGILGSDVVTVSATTANYNTKDAGTGKTITANNFVLAGAQQSNYNLTTTTAATTGNITASALTLVLNSSPLLTKVYDGTTGATLVPANYTLTGIQGADIVTVTGNANYNSKDFGTGKTITVNSFALAGAQKDNYSLTTTTATVIGNISTKALTVTADDKTKFQGAANPPLTLSYSGFITGEERTDLTTLPTASTTATIASAVGNYDITASGGSAVNYNFIFVKGTLKVIPGAPTSITLAAVPLFENRPVGTVVGTLNSTSDNPSSTFTYSLVAGTGDTDNAGFSIVGDQLRSAASFDFETKSSYSILVRSTTQYGLSLDKVITISLTDVNEIPTLAAIGNQTICYTRSSQNVALTGISAGSETTQTTILSVSSNNANLFDRLTVSGTGSTGTLIYQAKTGAAGSAIVTITVKDNGGTENGGVDTYSRTFVLTVNALPVLSISSDKGTQISKGETVFLTASGGATYAWTADGSIVNGGNSATLQARPRQTTTYTVTGTNASGCSETQSITITVLDDLAKIKATNILTPNGDGFNDRWTIDNIDFYTKNEVKVFDNTGRLVYNKKGYDNSWEGTYNGSPLAEGTYYYVIDFGTGRPLFKGYITIVREN